MTQTFNLQEFMTTNRNEVIAMHQKLSAEKFFSGITLKDFMSTVLRTMQMNAPKTAKRAASTLESVMGMIFMDNIQIGVIYTKPYAESNHAKQVNYFGKEKAAQLNNI